MKIGTLREAREDYRPSCFFKPFPSGLSAQSHIQAKCESCLIRKVEIASICSPANRCFPEANKCLRWRRCKSV